LFVGNTFDVYGRRYKVVEFADKFTKENLTTSTERTFVMIKPDSYMNIGKIVDYIIGQGNGLKISRA
jgi:hypothetical protein